jgi:DeoR/GlpR family transcriptional regulator of sugar metabolism
MTSLNRNGKMNMAISSVLSNAIKLRVIARILSIINEYCPRQCLLVSLFGGVYRQFQQYFSYIVAVSFIGGGNRMTRRKPPTCRKSLTNIIT